MTPLTTLGRLAACAIAGSAILLAGCGGGGGGGGGGAARSGSQSVTLSPPALPPASLGVAYSASLSSSGGTSPYAYSIVSGALPAGLALDGSTGAIAGTPTRAGLSTVTIQSEAANHDFGQEVYSLLVVAPVSISTSALAPGEERVPYAQRVDAQGGVGPYTWSVASGALPAGLSLAPSSGLSVQVTGMPTAPVASAGFDLRVQDGQGRAAVKHFTVSIANTYRVFFTADLDTAGVNELYEVVLDDALAARAPVKVSGTINPGDGDVTASFQLSPDGKKVAYLADAGADAIPELFVVDLSSGTPGPARRVNAPFTAATGGKAVSFLWSPDSTKLAWVAEAFVTNEYHVFFADVAGATITQRQADTAGGFANPSVINPINTGATAEDYAWSFDSRYLAFEADSRSANHLATTRCDAFVCDTATPLGQTATATRVNAPNLNNNGTVRWVQWAPGEHVLVFADSGAGTVPVTGTSTIPAEIYSVSISGAAVASNLAKVAVRPGELDSGAASPGNGTSCDFSPDGSRLAILYTTTGLAPAGPLSNALFLAPVTSTGLGTPVAVTTTPIDPTQTRPSYIQGYAWSPDSRTLLLGGGLQTPLLQSQMATCDVSGAAPGALVSIPVTSRAVLASQPYNLCRFAPDSQSFVYALGQGASPFFTDLDFQRVVASPVTVATQISGTIDALGPSVGLPQTEASVFFSPDSQWVAYISEENVDNQVELFAVDIGGSFPGPSVQVSPAPVSVNGDVQGTAPNSAPSIFRPTLGASPALQVPQWSSDSRFLLFRGDLAADERYDLWLWDASTPGAPAPVRIIPSLASVPGALGVSAYKLVD